ncbi:hypothetical protein K6W21_19360 [Burkholderia latens]|uniref:hypothetical protein n=1 Tax=Burkholderia latens TaxID=488446 RepID=UPI001C949638|nr:hypothetical protein [Burkholderia latens]MBY4696232.1 hypothetical protein [Burkholderia latens]
MVKALIDTDRIPECRGRPVPADAHLARLRPPHRGTVFGLWKTRAPDGLAYQQALRAEW